jgi:NAD(P)-dependent dehydrogenase (short-subunit alcohol dehydrogenase family)
MCGVVTDGAQGIGLECARAYVREGAWVAIVDLSAEQENEADIASYLDRIHPLGECPEGDVIADAAAFLPFKSCSFYYRLHSARQSRG